MLIAGDPFVREFSAEIAIPALGQKRLADAWMPDGRRLEIVSGGIQSHSGLLHLARDENPYRWPMLDAVIAMPDLTDMFDDRVRDRRLAPNDGPGPARMAPSPALMARARAERFLLVDRVPLRLHRKPAAAAVRVSARRRRLRYSAGCAAAGTPDADGLRARASSV